MVACAGQGGGRFTRVPDGGVGAAGQYGAHGVECVAEQGDGAVGPRFDPGGGGYAQGQRVLGRQKPEQLVDVGVPVGEEARGDTVELLAGRGSQFVVAGHRRVLGGAAHQDGEVVVDRSQRDTGGVAAEPACPGTRPNRTGPTPTCECPGPAATTVKTPSKTQAGNCSSASSVKGISP